ncbi:unnamed protein product [Dicrocoelium dendriticum]|nr:unnamed protein product [Dicrocoelium dendriticum]
MSVLSSVTSAAAPGSLCSAVTNIFVNDIPLQALIDTGSTESYISASVVKLNKFHIETSREHIVMASTTHSSFTQGHIICSIRHKDTCYSNVKLSVLSNLCSDVLLGHNFLKYHRKIEISFHGSRPPFTICGLLAALVEPFPLFEHLALNCQPIVTKSRRHSESDETFIQSEIKRLHADGIIQPSRSPWRAQVLVTTSGPKKRMVVDYSQTINRFTYLDAYPLPRIDDLIDKIARFDVYSTLDLKSAYHQIPINEGERKYTAFEAGGKLYEFCRIPFGVTNGVACFQRAIDSFLKREGIADTFAYVDNVTVCGRSKEEHDANLKHFLAVAKNCDITFNDTKSIFAVNKVTLLGYEISKGIIKPDPERLRPLAELMPPHDSKSQQRLVGMFA